MPTLPKPVDIPWPLSSFPGANPQESAGRLINVYAEPLGEGGPAKQVWRGSPGLTQHAATGQTGYRGGLIVANLSYELFKNRALTVDSAGNVTVLGTVAGTKGISIARNNAAAPNVIAVDLDNGAFQLDGVGAPSPYNGGGNLPQPKSVCFQDGYLFFGIADRRVFATGLNALTVNALTFTSVQAKSSDTLQRVIAFAGMLFVFCTSATEVWQDTAQPAPGFPYSRLVVMEYGLVQENAIAGFEDGFGVLLWVAQDFGVYMLTPGSFAPVKVSPPDLDRLIEASLRTGALLDVACYIFAGKKFWAVSDTTWSWEFNLGTQKWNERSSLQTDGTYGRWRGQRSHPAFGKWLVGDTLSGSLLFVDDTSYTENGAPLMARMESGPVQNFPNRVRIARADFDFVTGVGNPQVTPNPQVQIQLSRDGGQNWGNPWMRSIGAQGKSNQRVAVKNAGIAAPQGDRWRWSITDPVYRGFTGATQDTDPREK